MAALPKIEKELAAAAAKSAQLEKELGALHKQRTVLETQLTENKMVEDELKLLKEGETVFKLVGPTLLKQDSDEVKQNVDHRITHIKKGIETVEDNIKRSQKQMEEVRKTITELKTKQIKT
ncbi:unnamed protein product [Bursaphelenchus xylophilus]|uniref:(pine wood nematode) hypothetical protein n=1 Tax=Bursaphelenchus xylophilus TaxID=6326 RepID=A0A1I7RRA6_BURXY|nr:unnamed protein product [Bursaphelenchus xylophilus]CAG9130900.1 unnamed protein product [Bursaphelenchus xylophilus]